MKKRLRIVISGIGNRALPRKVESSNWLGWVQLIKQSGYFDLAAAHDVSEEAIKLLLQRKYLDSKHVFQNLDVMLEEINCDAILVSNPVESHTLTIRKALEYGLNILTEKPFVNDLSEGKHLVSLIKKSKKIAAVVQNWRSKDVGMLLYDFIQSGKLGRISHVFFRYVRDRENSNYPKYIFEEKYPLLYAMGIHHLDLLRYILKDEIESVRGNSFKPRWSLYRSDTGVNLFLEFKSGIPVIYSGTISSRNSCLPQESLLIEGEKGSIFNESQWLEPPLWFCPHQGREKIDLASRICKRSIVDQYNISDKFILKNFYQAITQNKTPLCSAEDGLKTVMALEACELACRTGKTIFPDDL